MIYAFTPFILQLQSPSVDLSALTALYSPENTQQGTVETRILDMKATRRS